MESLTLFIPNHWKGHLDFAHWLQFDSPSSGAHCHVDNATPFLKMSMYCCDLTTTKKSQVKLGYRISKQRAIQLPLHINAYAACGKNGMRRAVPMHTDTETRTHRRTHAQTHARQSVKSQGNRFERAWREALTSRLQSQVEVASMETGCCGDM